MPAASAFQHLKMPPLADHDKKLMVPVLGNGSGLGSKNEKMAATHSGCIGIHVACQPYEGVIKLLVRSLRLERQNLEELQGPKGNSRAWTCRSPREEVESEELHVVRFFALAFAEVKPHFVDTSDVEYNEVVVTTPAARFFGRAVRMGWMAELNAKPN